MKALLKDYPSESAPYLNRTLMEKKADRPLVDYVIDAWKSLEVVDSIKFLGYEYSDAEDEIEINKFLLKREKKKKKKEKFNYKFIDDDRFGLLTVHLQVTLMEKNLETGEEFEHVYPLRKQMLIPIQDENGYFRIRGKKFFLIYQLVDKSTYTSKNAVTLKSLMPVMVKRGIVPAHVAEEVHFTDEELRNSSITTEDSNGYTYILPYYNIYVFKKEIPVILFYLKDGFDSMLNYFGINGSMYLLSEMPEFPDDDTIYFTIGNHCYLAVNRFLFNKYPFIQSVVGGIIHVSSSRSTVASFYDERIWIKKISGMNSYEKGLGVLVFFGRLMDVTTKKILKVHPYNKQDIYSILRWMIQEFTILRLKDNLSLENKRLRCNEVISSLLTLEFSKRLNRIISYGSKATIDNYRDLTKFSGDRCMSPNPSNCGNELLMAGY